MAELLDLTELLNTPGMRVPYEVDLPCTPELELDCASNVTGRLVFTNTGNVLVVLGDVEVALRSTCPRCLADVTSILDAPVDEGFTVADGLVRCRADDEDGVVDPTVVAVFPEGNLLNLTELVRQGIVLAGPVEPLCREDCQGLCPTCGANRNETQCQCVPPVDSPLSALANLYKQEK
ncbi:MAG TPA: DUF177 domain-containing protein [Armatimonadota bacterium]|jgi:uncharacterized protein